MFGLPPLGLTPSWQAGKVMGPLWLVCQHLAKTVALHPFPQPCSHWLTAAKCFSPMSLFHRDHKQGGGDGDKGRCEAVGDRRDASTHQRLFWSSCANKEAFLVTPGHILTAQATLIGWDDRGRSKRACIDRISPLVSSKVNTIERERQKSTSVTQAAGDVCLQMSFHV